MGPLVKNVLTFSTTLRRHLADAKYPLRSRLANFNLGIPLNLQLGLYLLAEKVS